MHLLLPLLMLSLAPFTAFSAANVVRCSTLDVPLAKQMQVEQEIAIFREQFSRLSAESAANAGNQNIEIPVYFHVISKGESQSQGAVSDRMLTDQIDVLNSAYISARVQFRLQGIKRIINPSWFEISDDSNVERTVKQTLRQGDARTLNIYVAYPKSDGKELLGFATFPWDYAANPKMDGVVVNYKTLPGAERWEYDRGHTTTHEIGHWLGLFHTFQGGCSDGDKVSDTPASRGPNFGCPSSAPDTCQGNGQFGVDPIHNYMNYSDDACLSEFTDGQIRRVFEVFRTYRMPNLIRIGF